MILFTVIKIKFNILCDDYSNAEIKRRVCHFGPFLDCEISEEKGPKWRTLFSNSTIVLYCNKQTKKKKKKMKHYTILKKNERKSNRSIWLLIHPAFRKCWMSVLCKHIHWALLLSLNRIDVQSIYCTSSMHMLT